MTDLKDILIPLSTYPDPTPDHVVDWAIDFASLCNARVSAMVSVVDRKKLAKTYSHGSWLLDVPALIDAAIDSSGQNGRRLVEKFEREARKRNVFRDDQLEHLSFSSIDSVVQRARLRDLVLAPIGEFDEVVAADLVFGTGRPVILLPAYAGAPARPASVERIVVAWDYSRSASRALADAMPLLQKAKKVFVLTVSGEKDIPSGQSWKDIDRHLQMHGIVGEMDEVSVGSQTIGDTVRDYAAKQRADMLVMGAFGHSRLHEFVLGGASRNIISKPPLPVFMSH